MVQEFGRYKLHESIGKGGMAEVFRATLQGPKGFAKQVALKRVPSHLTQDDKNIQALVNEARIGALMRHRNIVEVYELAQEEDAWFIAMELIRGKTLWQLQRRCRATGAYLPRSIVLDVAVQASAALHYAHTFRDESGAAVGLIHRDLKPSNVMISDRGVVKLMDFGIARSSVNYYKAAVGGPVKGTPLYMSPEHLEGKELTPATDVFSFGVMLYEMLTNYRLFLAPSPTAVMARLVQMDLKPFFDPINKVDPGLGQLLSECLARDPADRMGTARELHQRLVQLRDATPPTPDLAEFVFYLQQAPASGMVDPDKDSPWTWAAQEGLAGPGGESDESLSIRRPLPQISSDLQQFGKAFFGQVLFPDADEREMAAAQKSVVPPYGSYRWDPHVAAGQRDVNTMARTAVHESAQQQPAEPPGEAQPDPPSRPAQTEPSLEPPAPVPPSTPLNSGPVDPIQPSGGSGMVRALAITAIAVLVVVALILVGVLAVLLTSGRPMKPGSVDQYVEAAEQGDWEVAATLAARASTQPDEPVARVILAMDAALAGQRHEAREILGDPEYYADPLRSRAWVLTAGLHRSQRSGYDDAAEAYGHALDCAGEGCEELIDAARGGLAVTCTVMDEPRPEACSRAEAPTWTSDTERQLVRSVVLRGDGHAEDAVTTLQAGLDSMASGADLGCAGVDALRDWMASDALHAGSELERMVRGAGRSAARSAEDCNTFQGPASSGQPR